MYIILLMLLWIVFNGKFTWEIFWIGLLVSSAIYLFCVKFIGYSFKSELKIIKKMPLVVKYLAVLLKEIVVANVIVLSMLIKGEKVSPVLYSFTSDLKTNGAKVALSHSITLTPGTITVELIDNIFIVHCLDKSLSKGLKDSEFIKILKQIESED